MVSLRRGRGGPVPSSEIFAEVDVQKRANSSNDTVPDPSASTKEKILSRSPLDVMSEEPKSWSRDESSEMDIWPLPSASYTENMRSRDWSSGADRVDPGEAPRSSSAAGVEGVGGG
jgi:hypothetical protein